MNAEDNTYEMIAVENYDGVDKHMSNKKSPIVISSNSE
jgi:hypothetical protein